MSRKKQAKRLGDRSDPWFSNVVGLRIHTPALESWYDFSDAAQVIFGYPESPGTHATIFPTQVHSGACNGIQVFLFVHVAEGILRDVSYSLIDIDPMGAMSPIDQPAFEPDIAAMEGRLFSITVVEDHPRIQSAIDARLREMSLDELTKARSFFSQVNDDLSQYQKYDKIVQEKNVRSN
jgi:hypothetical protein